MLTYGDEFADININELLAFHRNHGKLVTITSTQPAGRFGKLNRTRTIMSFLFRKTRRRRGLDNGGFL